MMDVRYKLVTFLETADKIIHEKEKEAIQELREYLLTDKMKDRFTGETRIPIKVLSELLDCMESQNDDVLRILEYFRGLANDIEKLKILDKLNISILSIDVTEVKSIYPKYIKDFFIKKYTEGCKEISAGADIKKEIRKVRDPNYLKGLKHAVIVCTVPEYARNGDIHRLTKKQLKRFSSANINEFISFLERYIYDEFPYFKEKVKEIRDVEAVCNLEMVSITETMLKIGERISAPGFLVNRYIYTQEMTYLELMKYVIAMTIRSINAWVRNLQIISQTYDVLRVYIPDMITENPLLEYGDDNPSEFGNPLDGENDSVRAFEPRIYEAIVALHKWVMDAFPDVSSHELSDPSYEDISKCLDIFKDGLRAFQFKLQDEESEYTSLDAIIEGCLLGECDWKKVLNTSIQKIRKMEFLKNGEFAQSVILKDLEVMRLQFENYSGKLLDLEERIANLKRDMNTNPNNIYKNPTRLKDAIEFLDKVMDAVVKIGRAITKAFEVRIHHVECKLRTPEPIDIEFDWHEYEESYLDCLLESSTDFYESELLHAENNLLRYYIERSASPFSTFVEEGENATDKKEESSNGEKKEGTDDKGDLKPKVTSSTDNGSNDTKSGTGENGSGSIAEKLKAIIGNLINTVNKFIAEGGKKNTAFLDKYEKALLEVDCNGLSMEIIPYKDTDYQKIVSDAMDRAGNMDGSILKSEDEKRIEEKLFEGTAFTSISGENTKERLVQLFKVGSEPLKLKTFSGDALHKEIQKMTKFCRYYNKTIPNDLDALKNRMDDQKIKALLDKKGSGDNDNTSKNVTVIKNALDAAITAMVSASRDRANDYILVLDKIANEKGLKKKESAN